MSSMIVTSALLILSVWIATTEAYNCNPKCQNGDCVAYLGELSCQCYGNWTGDACDQFVCETANPCLNNGVCGINATNVSKYICSCPLGYTGNRCQHKIPDGNPLTRTNCSNSSCGPHSVCYDTWEDPKGYYCDCHPGFYGPHCNFTVNPCHNVDCNGNGFCRIIVGRRGKPHPWCTCYGFYAAVGSHTYHCLYPNRYDFCHRDIFPCKNGGKCTLVDFPENYKCTCPPTHHGKDCDISFDVCNAEARRCLNGGTCVPDGHYFTCTCPPNYTGEKCELVIDQCKTSINSSQSSNACTLNPCGSNGVCSVANTTLGYSCTCSPGFTGPLCNQVNHCFERPCEDGEMCVNARGTFRCIALS